MFHSWPIHLIESTFSQINKAIHALFSLLTKARKCWYYNQHLRTNNLRYWATNLHGHYNNFLSPKMACKWCATNVISFVKNMSRVFALVNTISDFIQQNVDPTECTVKATLRHSCATNFCIGIYTMRIFYCKLCLAYCELVALIFMAFRQTLIARNVAGYSLVYTRFNR